MVNINNKTSKPNHLIEKEYELEIKIREIENDLPTYLADYFIYLKTAVSISSRHAYLTDIRFFFNYLTEIKKIDIHNIDSLNNLHARDVNYFLGDYCKRYFKETEGKLQVFENHNRSLSRKKSAIASMLKFMYRNEQISKDITPGFNPIKLPKPSPESIKRLRENELYSLINIVSTGEGLTEKEKIYWEKTKYRDKAIILLFVTYGLRLKELVNLDISSFNFNRKEFTIYRKREKESVMPLNTTIENAINDYLKLERNKMFADEALFISLQGKRITERAVRKLVKKYTSLSMQTSRKNAYSPHKLRATAASTLIERGFSIYDVQNLLDHDNVTTTQLYAAHKKNVKKNIIENFELDE